jgi:hypothetical protein
VDPIQPDGDGTVVDVNGTDAEPPAGKRPVPDPGEAGGTWQSRHDVEQAALADLRHDYPRWEIAEDFGGFRAVEKPAILLQAMSLARLRQKLEREELRRGAGS